MANPEHLEILKQGVEAWNQWRLDDPDIQPDLSTTDLSEADFSGFDFHWVKLNKSDLRATGLNEVNLSGADLSEADLREAYLRGVNLSGAYLWKACLSYANLSGIDLSGVDLSEANLSEADLSEANLSDANLSGANLSDANIRSANLRKANLYKSDLRESDLRGANFSKAVIDKTVFGDTNLSEATNLHECNHRGPSFIDQMTLVRSGKLPEVFLRGCGLSDEFIQYIPSLFWNPEPFQFYSCFISYSSKDEDFARRLHVDLQGNGVRCWFAPEDMKIGDKIRQRIDDAIRIYDKLLLILSENSITSTWVEKEIETAFEKEARSGQPVLFPIRLDNSVMETNTSWAADIRRTRHIGDFTRWKEHDAYQKGFERLLRDLRGDGEKLQ